MGKRPVRAKARLIGEVGLNRHGPHLRSRSLRVNTIEIPAAAEPDRKHVQAIEKVLTEAAVIHG